METILRRIKLGEPTKLEFVHSDLCGPTKTASLGGAKYFITFNDDFSRSTWIYFVKYKSQTLNAFKVEAENESNKKNKVLKTNNGG